MKDELEKAFDRIAVSAVPEQEDYTDSETGLLHCGTCHTPKQCRVEIFGKEKLMPCTCRCRHEQLAAEEQARQDQVYNVVDSRYLSRLPFIITTNTETMNDKIKRMLKNEI